MKLLALCLFLLVVLSVAPSREASMDDLKTKVETQSNGWKAMLNKRTLGNPIESINVDAEVTEEACIQITITLAEAVTLGVSASIRATAAATFDATALQLAAHGQLSLDVGPLVFKIGGAIEFELAANYLLPFKTGKPMSMATLIVQQFGKDLTKRFLNKKFAGATGKNEATVEIDVAMTAQKLLTGLASVSSKGFTEVKTPVFQPYPGATGFYTKAANLALKQYVMFFFDFHKYLKDSATKMAEQSDLLAKFGAKRDKAGKVIHGGNAVVGQQIALWLEAVVFMKHFMPDRFKSLSGKLEAFPNVKETYDGKDLSLKNMDCGVLKKENIPAGKYNEQQYLESMICIFFKHGLGFTSFPGEPEHAAEEVPEPAKEPSFGDAAKNPFKGKEDIAAFLETDEESSTGSTAASRAKRRMHLAYKKIDQALSRRADTKTPAFIELEDSSEMAVEDLAKARLFPSLARMRGNPKNSLGESLQRMFPSFSYPGEGGMDFPVFALPSSTMQLGSVGSLPDAKLQAFATSAGQILTGNSGQDMGKLIADEYPEVINAYHFGEGTPDESVAQEIITLLTSQLTMSTNLLKLHALMMEPGTFGVAAKFLNPSNPRFAPQDATFSFAWTVGMSMFQANNFCAGDGPMFSRTTDSLYEYRQDLSQQAASEDIPEDKPCEPVEPGRAAKLKAFFRGYMPSVPKKVAAAAGAIKRFVSATVHQQNWYYLGKTVTYKADFFQNGQMLLSYTNNVERGKCSNAVRGWEGVELHLEMRVAGELPKNLVGTGDPSKPCSWNPDPTELYTFWQCTVGNWGISPTAYGSAGVLVNKVANLVPAKVTHGSTWGVDITLGLHSDSGGFKPHVVELVFVSDTVSEISGEVTTGLTKAKLSGTWTSTAQVIATFNYPGDGKSFSIRRAKRALNRGRGPADGALTPGTTKPTGGDDAGTLQNLEEQTLG